VSVAISYSGVLIYHTRIISGVADTSMYLLVIRRSLLLRARYEHYDTKYIYIPDIYVLRVPGTDLAYDLGPGPTGPLVDAGMPRSWSCRETVRQERQH